MSLVWLMPVQALAASPAKSDICHISKSSGRYTLRSITDTAFERHLAHGDVRVGDPVPDMDGYVFAEDCSIRRIPSNVPPTSPVVAIIPTPAASGELLTATIITPSTDADGDPITYAYFWHQDGVPYANPTYPSANNTIAGGTTSNGEFWEVDVVPNDGFVDGTAGVASALVNS